MDRLMSAKEIGEILNISSRTVRRMAEARVIPGARRIGRLWRFDPKKFQKWLADLETPEVEMSVAKNVPIESMESVL